MPPTNSPSNNTPSYLLPPPSSSSPAGPSDPQPFDLTSAEQRILGLLVTESDRSRTTGVVEPRITNNTATAEPPRLPTTSIMSRTLPLPESGSSQSHRQPYGNRPPRRQSLYDWAPHTFDPFFDYPQDLDLSTLLGHPFRDTQGEGSTETADPAIRSPESDNDDDHAISNLDLLRFPHMSRPNRPARNAVVHDSVSSSSQATLERLLRNRGIRPRLGLNNRGFSQLTAQDHRRMNQRDAYNFGLSPESSRSLSEINSVLKYLTSLRLCRTPTEALNSARKHMSWRDFESVGACSRGGVPHDLLVSTRSLKVSETSWLRSGAVFTGTQSASSREGTPRSIHSPISSHLSRNQASSNSKDWQVVVKVTSVDYDEMRLTGTMEATGEWGNPNNTSKKIVTYLEGEIIDFYTHTLKTLNFQVEDYTDAQYWSKLEPFSSLSLEGKKNKLVSKSYMKELMNDWVLMRWKEKCFLDANNGTESVSDSDGSSVLTISGFYYISMRRSNGFIQGHYYDPAAQPHQELILTPKKRVEFPVLGFR